MTATTPKQNLRYPTGTDSPCKGSQQIRDLRDDIYDRLDAFDTTITRQKDLPVTSIAYNGPPYQEVPVSLVPMAFNTLEQDNLRAADLIANNNRLTLGTDPDLWGYYIVGFIGRVVFTTAVNMTLTPDPLTADADDFDYATHMTALSDENQPAWSASGLVRISASTIVQLTFSPDTQWCGGGLCNPQVEFMRLYAIRLGGL